MSRGVQYNRTPCPGRVFEDLGNGFAMGCFGGSLLYFAKGNHFLFFTNLGAWNAPRRQRIFSGLCHVRNRAPFLGGNFGLWGGIFSSVDCLLIYYRQKDDPYNAIAAGFITGGVLAIRGGISVAFRQAMIGGVILMVIETVGTLMQAIMMKKQLEFQAEMQRQEIARMRGMMARGGDNPYAVSYNEE
jgi:import inner membrane translocase subunit TIM17